MEIIENGVDDDLDMLVDGVAQMKQILLQMNSFENTIIRGIQVSLTIIKSLIRFYLSMQHKLIYVILTFEVQRSYMEMG